MNRLEPPGEREYLSPANFDRVARVYRWAEYVCLGPLLRHMREHFLGKTADARRFLVLGDGDGRFLAAALRRSPHARALAIDSSARMLQLLRQRCAFAADRLTTLQSDLTEALPVLARQPVDLIVSHFFLDCLSQRQLDALTWELARAMPPGTRWLLSDFGFPPRQPWRALAQGYVRVLYAAFGLLSRLTVRKLPDIEGSMLRAGFLRVHRSERWKGLVYSEIWQKPLKLPATPKPHNAQPPDSGDHPPLM